MKINMNDPVTVTLTAHGAAVWNARYDGMPIADKYKPAPNVAGDLITTQFWDLMHVFGPGVYMGMLEVPFLDNALEVEA